MGRKIEQKGLVPRREDPWKLWFESIHLLRSPLVLDAITKRNLKLIDKLYEFNKELFSFL